MRVQTSKFDWVAWVLTDAFASERGAWCACLAGPHTMERRFCCSCAALRRALADFERLLQQQAAEYEPTRTCET